MGTSGEAEAVTGREPMGWDGATQGRGGAGRPLRLPLLSPMDLASYLGVPVATIYRWRSHGDGPMGFRVGRHVRYRLEDVDQWLDEQRRDRA